VRIEHVFETHNHADHVSGHGRLAAATGAAIHIHRLAEPDYAHEPFDDGDSWEHGSLLVRALHTPGHRPEHTAFALIDRRRSEEPWAVLTGDTLFVGDVEVWPGHLGGSMCGGPGDLPERADDVQILDVRERSEWDEGHIPGSVFTPWHDIDGLPEGLDPDHPIAVVCGSGQRAAVAASLKRGEPAALRISAGVLP
jgi:glyoxylase-like metal-dependent hydrolase (beta-lactamase superfamily II)